MGEYGKACILVYELHVKVFNPGILISANYLCAIILSTIYGL